MVALAAAIETLTALTELNLSYNDVSPAAAERLARSLEILKRLEEFKLERCHIADSGARQIVAAAVDLPNLRNLNLVDNHISPDVEGQLEEETRERTQLWWETHRSEGLCVGTRFPRLHLDKFKSDFRCVPGKGNVIDDVIDDAQRIVVDEPSPVFAVNARNCRCYYCILTRWIVT
ncbi:hypothetical protein LSAT2_002418 [Lamellibrachia satsuma]|nr:hypothetical protein LSAT2_002418 [Lamellibrachia satsuma]